MAPAPGATRRARILAHLADHPNMTGYELARVIGTTTTVTDLLRAMEYAAEVVATTAWRPQQGRQVRLWRIAPPGTVPRAASPAADRVKRRREQDRLAAQARRARTRQPGPAAVALPGAECRTTAQDLFFPEPGDTGAEARALAVCARCPVRAQCYAHAVENGERWGIWGGVNFESEAGRCAS